MTKKLLKFSLALIISSFLVFYSLCFADETNVENVDASTQPDETILSLTTADNNEETENEDCEDEDCEDEDCEDENCETTEETEEENEIYYGDLYLFDTNVKMDKLVDGNVYIVGSDVEITGQVNGNLFVCANTVSFNESYVQYDIFVCANSIYYNGACYDLYSASKKLEMTYNSYVVRDIKAASSETILKAAVGRDVDLYTNTLDVGSGDDIPIIYGNLRYTANSEVTIPEGIIQEGNTATYNSSLTSSSSTISDMLFNIITKIITILVIALLFNIFLPNIDKTLDSFSYSIPNFLKSLAIGLGTILVAFILSIILVLSEFGIQIAALIACLILIICIINIPLFAMSIANLLMKYLHKEKGIIYYLLLTLISILLYGISLIPFAGLIIQFIIISYVIGNFEIKFIKNNKNNKKVE